MPAVNNNGSNRNKAEMVRLLLRLPDEHGTLPGIGVWPKQKDVADALGLSHGRIPQMLKEERRRWKAEPAVQALRDEIIDLLVGMGRVASAVEVADALAVRRGTHLAGREQRRAMALAAVRAVVEVEQLLPQEAEFQHQPNRKATDESLGAGLLALDVREDDGPDTPTAPGLLEYASRLGRTADRLARLDTLPTAATVLAELGALTVPPGAVDWDERRMVELAAAASVNAAATPRLEIYPRDLPLVRALRLTQAGLVRWIPGMPEGRQPGLTAEAVHERVRARFPEMVVPDGRGGTTHELPTGGPLTKALRDAGFDLSLSTHEREGVLRYLPTRVDDASSFLTTGAWRQSTRTGAVTRYADDPQLAGAVRAEERLLASARRDGYRVLTVRQQLVRDAVRELGAERLGAHAVSVTELFLQALRAQLTPGTKPTWDTLLKADAAEPGSKGAVRFAEYARTAWGTVEPRITDLLGEGGGAGPVLLTEAAVFARYDAMGVLDRLASAARRGGRGLWLVVPQPDPSREPRLGQVAVPYQAGLGSGSSFRTRGSATPTVGPVRSWHVPLSREMRSDRPQGSVGRPEAAGQGGRGRPRAAGEGAGEVGARLRSEYDRARKLGRTAATWNAWLDERVTQVAVAWVLGTVFVRFCEDNRLIPEPYLTGPDGDRRELAEARYDAYVESDEDPTYRGWLERAFEELGQGQAGRLLFDRRHNPLYQIPLSHDGARELVEFWRGGTRRVSSSTTSRTR